MCPCDCRFLTDDALAKCVRDVMAAKVNVFVYYMNASTHAHTWCPCHMCEGPHGYQDACMYCVCCMYAHIVDTCVQVVKIKYMHASMHTYK